MTDLSDGGAGMPRNWGVPSALFNYKTGTYDTGGMVWYGKDKATPKARQALKKVFGPNVNIDELSTVGMRDPEYTTFRVENVGKGPYRQTIVFTKK